MQVLSVTCWSELEQDANNGENVQCRVVRRRVYKQRSGLAVEKTVFEQEIKLDSCDYIAHAYNDRTTRARMNLRLERFSGAENVDIVAAAAVKLE